MYVCLYCEIIIIIIIRRRKEGASHAHRAAILFITAHVLIIFYSIYVEHPAQ